ncbi:LysE family translocator [Spiribacter salilacus]|nr:LysE family transporter [Spiribacter salilacus]
MHSVLPLLGIFAVFSPALMLPGPDFVVVVRNTIARGKRAGVLTAFGISIGIIFYASLSAFGLSALLNSIAWFEWAVRAVGASFLGYLGVRLLLAQMPDSQLEQEAPKTPAGPDNPVLLGLLVNLTNPKAIIFFASIFGAAIRPQTPFWLLLMVVLAVGVAGLFWFSMVSILTASTGWLIRLEDYQHWIERLAGVAFLGFAVKIVFDLIQQ